MAVGFNQALFLPHSFRGFWAFPDPHLSHFCRGALLPVWFHWHQRDSGMFPCWVLAQRPGRLPAWLPKEGNGQSWWRRVAPSMSPVVGEQWDGWVCCLLTEFEFTASWRITASVKPSFSTKISMILNADKLIDAYEGTEGKTDLPWEGWAELIILLSSKTLKNWNNPGESAGAGQCSSKQVKPRGFLKFINQTWFVVCSLWMLCVCVYIKTQIFVPRV